jgi:RecA-family ATPase
VGLLVGESQAGKSFLAILLGACLSIGKPFFTKRVKQVGTVYVAAEAAATVPERLNAVRNGVVEPLLAYSPAKMDNFDFHKLPISVIESVPDLVTEEGRQQLIAAIRETAMEMEERHGLPLRLVIIDTLLAAFGLDDWNSPSDTSDVMKVLAFIAQECDVAVVGVHHHGKDRSRGATGSYALTAAADFIISAFRDADDSGDSKRRWVALTKSRRGATGWQCEFELVSLQVDLDEVGEAVYSAYVFPKTESAGFTSGSKSRPKKQSMGEGGAPVQRAPGH